MDSLILGSLALGAAGLGSYFSAVDDVETPTDIMSEARIKSYPYLAALTLLSMNLLLEYLGPSNVNFIFMFYFGLAGTNSIWFLLRCFIKFKAFRTHKLFMYPSSKSIITEFALPPRPVPFYVGDLLLYGIALAINVYYYQTKDHIANNIIAFSISFFGVLSIRITKFTNAAPLLWMLLIYDVFFVYSTDMMSSVALYVQGPIKLIVRKGGGYSILGLGDIVIPGLFLSVCARFDAYLKNLLHINSYYWITGIIGYVVAMIMTDVVCYITNEGQPALLYITPCITIPILIMAFIRKEQYAFLSFSG